MNVNGWDFCVWKSHLAISSLHTRLQLHRPNDQMALLRHCCIARDTSARHRALSQVLVALLSQAASGLLTTWAQPKSFSFTSLSPFKILIRAKICAFLATVHYDHFKSMGPVGPHGKMRGVYRHNCNGAQARAPLACFTHLVYATDSILR
jgi:hypothetical protein